MKDTFKTAVCIGKQPSSDVWIFGLDIQITANRLLANPKASSILWVQEVFDMEDGGKMKKLDQDGSGWITQAHCPPCAYLCMVTL